MTIPRYIAFTRYWTEWPPVHKLVAAYMGYKGKKEEESLDEFLEMAKSLMMAEGG